MVLRKCRQYLRWSHVILRTCRQYLRKLCNNSEWLNAVNYFCKVFHLRYFAGLKYCLLNLWSNKSVLREEKRFQGNDLLKKTPSHLEAEYSNPLYLTQLTHFVPILLLFVLKQMLQNTRKPVACSESCETSKMECLQKLLTAKSYLLFSLNALS